MVKVLQIVGTNHSINYLLEDSFIRGREYNNIMVPVYLLVIIYIEKRMLTKISKTIIAVQASKHDNRISGLGAWGL